MTVKKFESFSDFENSDHLLWRNVIRIDGFTAAKGVGF
jgi:hypothetical protein